MRLLSRRDRKLTIVLVVVQVLLGFLDLLGVALIGLMSSLAVTGISQKQTGDRVTQVLEILRLQDQEARIQFAVLGIVASSFLATKTLASMYVGRRILFFLSSRTAKVSSELLKKYFSLPISFIRRRNSQEAMYALTSGVGFLTLGVIGSWANLVSDLTLMFVMGLGLFLLDAGTTIGVFAIFALVAFVLYQLTHQKVDELGTKQARLAIDSNRHISEAISTYRELLVRNRRGHYANLISQMRFSQARGAAELSFLGTVAKYVIELTVVFSTLAIAGYQFATQPPSRATAIVAVFLMASARISPAILRIQQGLIGIKTSSANATPTIELIQEVRGQKLHSGIRDSDLVREHKNFKKSIHVRSVSFTYPGTKRITLDQLSFDIPPGSFVGIVGASGSGKSTLLDLILGVLSPDKGKIELSGLSPEECLVRWPGAVAYVPQHVAIFDGTIKSNIELGYGPGTISDELCWEMLQLACLSAEVSELQYSIYSEIGEGGFKLSGGQRQRLGIARALVTNPYLMIIDEATSALDGKTEQQLMKNIIKTGEKRTVVSVAHRLSTIKDADLILLLDSGHLVDKGTFGELRRRNRDFKSQAKLAGL